MLFLDRFTLAPPTRLQVFHYICGKPTVLRNLISLRISSPLMELKAFNSILTASKFLKHLRITVNECKENDWMEIASSFEKIKLTNLTVFVKLTDLSNGIEHFLRTQHHLEELEINPTFLNADLVDAITKMEKLKTLKLFSCNGGSANKNVEGNMKAIESLKISWSSDFQTPTFDSLINCASNLKTLEITELDQNWLNKAGLKLKKMKILSILILNVTDISNPCLFPALEKVEVVREIDQRQRELIQREIENELTNFKRCLNNEFIKQQRN